MAKIHLYPTSHNKIDKLSAAEQEKMNKLLAMSPLTQGWLKNKSDRPSCNAREVSEELQQEHQKKVYSVSPVNFLYPVCPPYFPVCPVLKEMISEEKPYSLPDIKKTNLPLLDSIIKILVVFNSLTQLKPDEETVVKCAHSKNLLTERLDLIRNDLLALPQSLEKDFSDTSKECRELIAGLKLSELQYFMNGQSLVYLLPDHLESGNYATFLKWREQQINLANVSDESVRIEMCRLTRHYPAEAIKVIRELSVTLSPLVKILSEQAKTISQLIAQGEGPVIEFKETLEYDIKANKNSKDVLLSALKTISGFLNSNGGTLLIGVNDSGEIKGIERDLSTLKHRNNDRFEQKIRNCLKDRFTPQPIGKVSISFEKFAEGTICRVDVSANKEIIRLNDCVYVRDGNTTQKPEGADLDYWIQQREK